MVWLYICKRCGAVFETSTSLRVFHPEIGGAWENFSVCPACGGDDIRDAEVCTVCGEYTDETENGACPACADGVRERFRALYDSLTPAERKVADGL